MQITIKFELLIFIRLYEENLLDAIIRVKADHHILQFVNLGCHLVHYRK